MTAIVETQTGELQIVHDLQKSISYLPTEIIKSQVVVPGKGKSERHYGTGRSFRTYSGDSATIHYCEDMEKIRAPDADYLLEEMKGE